MSWREVLHPLSDFIDPSFNHNSSLPNYWYEGYCQQSGNLLRLPRTDLAEAIALALMQYLDSDEVYAREGKMYGLLLVETPTGEVGVIKAFSGLLNGESCVAGWVPPIPGRQQVALDEARTLKELDTIKQELITLQALPVRQEYQVLEAEFTAQLQAISQVHKERKYQRQERRLQLQQSLSSVELTIALAQMEEESRQDGIQRRRLKQQRDSILQPLQQAIASADQQIQQLKQRRKQLSRDLQTQMHAAYSLMNFLGQSLTLQQLVPYGLPTGTGDCCAPKLLHYAATQRLKPLAMAEFWWGSSSEDKIQGEFYGACRERCQPLMGFLLSGLIPNPPTPFPCREGGVKNLFISRGGREDLDIIYQDEWLIAVNKPSGLLSVPGRYLYNQDSVLSRLRHQLPKETELMTVHRLDQDTSGILLLAWDTQTHRQLSQQFQQRKVNKTYEAIVVGYVTPNQGRINLPLWGNPENRPYQQVDYQHGKPSVTDFRVLAREGNYTRIEFFPLTGRTHQLRVHAADKRGLGTVILGDRFYGCTNPATRLHLHARELRFHHPRTQEMIHLMTTTPF